MAAARMTVLERDALDAKVLAKVAAGAHPQDVEGPLDRYFQNKVEASVARLKRASKIAYDHKAKEWRVVAAKRGKASVRVLDVEATGAGVGPALAALGEVAGAKRAPAAKAWKANRR